MSSGTATPAPPVQIQNIIFGLTIWPRTSTAIYGAGGDIVFVTDQPDNQIPVEGVTGRYYEDCAEAKIITERASHTRGVAPYVLDVENADRLWQISNQLTQ
jgi:hypothetical protein